MARGAAGTTRRALCAGSASNLNRGLECWGYGNKPVPSQASPGLVESRTAGDRGDNNSSCFSMLQIQKSELPFVRLEDALFPQIEHAGHEPVRGMEQQSVKGSLRARPYGGRVL